MPADRSDTPFRDQVLLAVIDKLLLGLIVAAGAFILSLQLQRNEKTIEYQQAIFQRRLDAYAAIVSAARTARDEFVLLHSGDGSGLGSGELIWRVRLEKERRKAASLASGSGGASSSWTTYDEALDALGKVEAARRDNSLYVSPAVDEATEKYLETLWRDASRELSSSGNLSRDVQFQRDSAQRAATAYESLVDAVRTSLRVGDLILG